MSLRRANSNSTTSRLSTASMSYSSNVLGTPAHSAARLNQSLISGELGASADADVRNLNQQLHQLEMENQRLRMELQRRPTQREHSEQREEMEKVEMLFARGSQENEKLMLRMKEKEDREKELERALCNMLGQDWAIQLGVSHALPTTPAMDFESTPLPAHRSFRSAGQTIAQNLQGSLTSPGTPIAQISRPRSRQPSQSSVSINDRDLLELAPQAGSDSVRGLSPPEVQQLLRMLLDPAARGEQDASTSKIEPELIRSFVGHLEDCKEQLLEQERRGEAREARIRGLLEEAKSIRA